MGVATEFVVEAAARHAADADFRVIVLEDCCAAFSDDAHRVSTSYYGPFGYDSPLRRIFYKASETIAIGD